MKCWNTRSTLRYDCLQRQHTSVRKQCSSPGSYRFFLHWLVIGQCFLTMFFQCNRSNTHTMANDFCTCLKEEDWPCIKKEVNGFLNSLNTREDEQNNFEKIKTWLASFPCVSEVAAAPGEIRTDPPIKEFIVKINTAEGEATKTIPIRFSSKKYEINID